LGIFGNYIRENRKKEKWWGKNVCEWGAKGGASRQYVKRLWGQEMWINARSEKHQIKRKVQRKNHFRVSGSNKGKKTMIQPPGACVSSSSNPGVNPNWHRERRVKKKGQEKERAAT